MLSSKFFDTNASSYLSGWNVSWMPTQPCRESSQRAQEPLIEVPV
jgi:hypothetical protein